MRAKEVINGIAALLFILSFLILIGCVYVSIINLTETPIYVTKTAFCSAFTAMLCLGLISMSQKA
jgi:hypothetical protein